MKNFYYYNPTKILFGRGMLPRITHELNMCKNALLLYGLRSLKQNGIYQKIRDVLDSSKISVFEFGGIDPNPEYEKCLEAIRYARENDIDFIIAAGGGSVIDAAKFISLASRSDADDSWGIVTNRIPAPSSAIPLGCIVTAPGTGSEMNNAFVLSRRKATSKLAYSNILLYPKFSLLDPEFTFSLSPAQTALGVVDAYCHVLEQYMVSRENTPLQDRQSEAVLLTLIEIAPKLLNEPENYDLRATMMWCSAQALNSTLSRGVTTDWSTHEIGHALTAIYDIPHAQTLAVLLGLVYRNQLQGKLHKLAQYGRRVWSLDGSDETVAAKGIELTEAFFESLGVVTKFDRLGLCKTEVAADVKKLLEEAAFSPIGENRDITLETVVAILDS